MDIAISGATGHGATARLLFSVSLDEEEALVMLRALEHVLEHNHGVSAALLPIARDVRSEIDNALARGGVSVDQ